MPKRLTIQEEIFTHEYLWRSSKALAKIVETDEVANHHLIIPALVMTLMAFEAFINFCGFVVLPDLWANEREQFRGKGVDGKLTAINHRLPKFEWRKGEEPYQSITKLVELRDLVVHGKVYASEYETEYRDDGRHFRWEHPWDSYLSGKSVEKAREDVRSFCQTLLAAMREESDHPHLLHDAFDGPLARGSGSGVA